MASFMALLFAWNSDDRHPFFNYISHVTSALEVAFMATSAVPLKIILNLENFHVKNINSRAISGLQLSPNLPSTASSWRKEMRRQINSS